MFRKNSDITYYYPFLKVAKPGRKLYIYRRGRGQLCFRVGSNYLEYSISKYLCSSIRYLKYL